MSATPRRRSTGAMVPTLLNPLDNDNDNDNHNHDDLLSRLPSELLVLLATEYLHFRDAASLLSVSRTVRRVRRVQGLWMDLYRRAFMDETPHDDPTAIPTSSTRRPTHTHAHALDRLHLVRAPSREQDADVLPDELEFWRRTFLSRRAVEQWKNGLTAQSPLTLEGHQQRVTCLKMDGDKLVSGALDGSVRLFDLRTGARLGTLRDLRSPVTCIDFNEGLLISGALDSSVRVYSLDTSECVRALKRFGPGTPVTSVMVQSTEQCLVAGMDETLRVVDPDHSAKVRLVPLDTGALMSMLQLVDRHPDVFLAASLDAQPESPANLPCSGLSVLDLRIGGSCVAQYAPIECGGVRKASLSHVRGAQQLCAVAGIDASVRLYDVRRMETELAIINTRQLTTSPNEEPISDVAISGNTLLTLTPSSLQVSSLLPASEPPAELDCIYNFAPVVPSMLDAEDEQFRVLDFAKTDGETRFAVSLGSRILVWRRNGERSAGSLMAPFILDPTLPPQAPVLRKKRSSGRRKSRKHRQRSGRRLRRG